MDILIASALLEYFYLFVAVISILGAYLLASRARKYRHTVFIWGATGIVFNLFSLSFLYTAYPIAWLPEQHQLFFIALLHVLMSSVAGIGFLYVGVAHALMQKYKPHEYLTPFLLGVAGVCAEVLRSYCLSLLFYTPGKSTVGLHWSAGTFGNGLSVTPLIEYAYFGGPYILSGILILLIVAVCQKKKVLLIIYTGVVCLLCVFIHYMVPVHGPGKAVSIAVASLTGEVLDANMFTKNAQFITSELEKSKKEIDVLIVPEDTRLVSHLTEKEKKVLLATGLSEVIDGDSILYHGLLSNFSYLYSLTDDTLLGRGKFFLFPFSEYLPASFHPFMKRLLGSEALTTYIHDRTYTIGKEPQVFMTPSGGVGTLLCSEMFSYEAIQALTKKENPASLIVLQSHLPVFHKNVWLFMQYLSITKIIAAETRTPLVVSAYDAPSMVVNQYGDIVMIRPPENSVQFFSFPGGAVDRARK